MWKCEKCGFCCCGKGNLIYLTEEEKKSEIYRKIDTVRKNGDKAVTLPKKTFFHKRSRLEIEACYYLNTETFLCEIYDNRPETCKRFTCENKQKSKYWSKK